MPALHRLPANVLRTLATLSEGKHGDGGGLWLLRRKDGGAQWSFRYTAHGRAREMGLGSAANLTLADARRLAERWRGVVASGQDPQKIRRHEREKAAEERPTFASVAEAAYLLNSNSLPLSTQISASHPIVARF